MGEKRGVVMFVVECKKRKSEKCVCVEERTGEVQREAVLLTM